MHEVNVIANVPEGEQQNVMLTHRQKERQKQSLAGSR